MIDLAAVQTGLKAWVVSLLAVAGITETAALVQFENESRVRAQGGRIELSWLAMPIVGVDDRTYAMTSGAPAPTPNLTQRSVTQRRMSLQISIDVYDQRPAVNAWTMAAAIHSAAYTDTSAGALLAINLGLIDVGGPTKADYRQDGRLFSRVILDVAFNQADVTEDLVSTPVGSVEHAIVSSAYVDPNGALLPAAEQLVHVEMPA